MKNDSADKNCSRRFYLFKLFCCMRNHLFVLVFTLGNEKFMLQLFCRTCVNSGKFRRGNTKQFF